MGTRMTIPETLPGGTEAAVEDLPGAVDRAEERAGGAEAACLEPAAGGADGAGGGVLAGGDGDLGPRALLVGLGAADGDDEAAPGEGDVADIQAHQFGA